MEDPVGDRVPRKKLKPLRRIRSYPLTTLAVPISDASRRSQERHPQHNSSSSVPVALSMIRRGRGVDRENRTRHSKGTTAPSHQAQNPPDQRSTPGPRQRVCGVVVARVFPSLRLLPPGHDTVLYCEYCIISRDVEKRPLPGMGDPWGRKDVRNRREALRFRRDRHEA